MKPGSRRLVSREKLQEAMDFRGIKTGVELARLAGLSIATVGHLRSGERPTCSAKTADALEEALGCRPGYLFVPVESMIDADHQPDPEGAAA